MLRSIAVAYLNPVNFIKMSLIFGRGFGFLTICIFNFLKSVSNHTSPVFLGIINGGVAHPESLVFFKTAKYSRRFISFLVVTSRLFGIGYVTEFRTSGQEDDRIIE